MNSLVRALSLEGRKGRSTDRPNILLEVGIWPATHCQRKPMEAVVDSFRGLRVWQDTCARPQACRGYPPGGLRV